MLAYDDDITLRLCRLQALLLIYATLPLLCLRAIAAVIDTPYTMLPLRYSACDIAATRHAAERDAASMRRVSRDALLARAAYYSMAP